MKILANGLVFVQNQLQQADLAFDEKIRAIATGLEGERIDCRGKTILPGVIDVHVHFRDFQQSHEEDWQSGSRAAVRGGVTTVFDMPNNDPPATTLEMLREKRGRAEASLVNGKIYAGLTQHNTAQIPELAKAADAFKLYLGETTGGLLIDEPTLQREIFRRVAKTEKVLTVHAQRGGVTPEEITSHEAEDIQYAIALAREAGARLHIAHVATRAGVQTVQEAKRRGVDVSFETCPPYLCFTAQDRARHGAYMKVNPPVATPSDRVSLWEALRAGQIDMIATDHAPHTIEEKNLGLERAPSGLPGVEFLLPLMLDAVNGEKISLARLVEVCCTRPAQRFGLSSGEIRVGLDADLTVVDMNLRRTITRAMIWSKCGWSPYEGMTLQGWPVMTFVKGGLVYDATSS